MPNNNWASDVLEAVTKLAYSPANSWDQAANYAALPNPATCGGATWLVLLGTGIWPVNKPSGWYYSNGASWSYLGAYNPVVTGGNVTVTNFPTLSTVGQCATVSISNLSATEILLVDPSRKDFVLTVPNGIIYVGLGFTPSNVQYSYRLTNNSVLEKDFAGAVYAVAEESPKTVYITEIK